MQGRAKRLTTVAGAALAVVAATVLPGAPAAAMPTTNCTQKGTTGNDTINVDVPSGTTVVVCAGAGTDTININSIADPTNVNTRLWIAFGAGQKTVNWNAGAMTFGSLGSESQGIIVRPVASPNIVLGGTNSDSSGSFLVCGTNAQFKTAANGTDLRAVSGAMVLFKSAGNFNIGSC